MQENAIAEEFLADPGQLIVGWEVQCTVQVLYEPTIEDDCGFVDPDTYTLSLTIATPSHSSAEAGSPDAPQTHPKIILTTYRGWKESMDAPDWTRRKPGRELVFRQSKQELALLLSRVASARANVKPLIKQLESMQL